VLRLAWTLADLAEVDVPGPEHVGHALRFRLGPGTGVAA
jgi:predicted ATPase with chaperone activity